MTSRSQTLKRPVFWGGATNHYAGIKKACKSNLANGEEFTLDSKEGTFRKLKKLTGKGNPVLGTHYEVVGAVAAVTKTAKACKTKKGATGVTKTVRRKDGTTVSFCAKPRTAKYASVAAQEEGMKKSGTASAVIKRSIAVRQGKAKRDSKGRLQKQ